MNETNTEFDDIVLEKNPKSERTKKILLRAIILIIVFLIVIIAMKYLNSSPKEELANSQTMPPPPAASKQDFQNSPIVQEKKDDEYNALLKDIKDKEDNASSNVFGTPPSQKAEEKQANAQATAELNTEVKSETPPVAEENADAKTIISEAFDKPGTPKPEKELAKAKTVHKIKPASKPVKAAKEKVASANDLFSSINVKGEGDLAKGIYIQLYAVTKVDPNAKALKKLREQNYKYIIYKINRNGKQINKILVGPIAAKEVKSELAKLRKDISKGAYSFRIK